jgi:hypothetical protein
MTVKGVLTPGINLSAVIACGAATFVTFIAAFATLGATFLIKDIPLLNNPFFFFFGGGAGAGADVIAGLNG